MSTPPVTTVESIISQEQFTGVELLCGEQGLQNRVADMVVIDQPGLGHWLRGEEFLLTTGYPYSQKPASLSEDVRVFISKGEAALAFRDGPLVPALTEEDRRLADRAGFPIMKVPGHVNWTDVVSSFYRSSVRPAEMLQDCNCPSLSRTRFFEQILFPGGATGYQTDSRRTDWQGTDDIALMRSSYLTCSIKARPELSREVRGLLERATADGEVTLVQGGDLIVLVHPGVHSIDSVNSFVKTLEEALSADRFRPVLPAVVSWPVSLGDMRACHRKSCAVMALSKLLASSKAVIRSSDMDLLLMLTRSNLVSTREFCLSRLRRLVEHDASTGSRLVETLNAYFDCDFSVQNAAKQLYVHPSTVKHRLACAYKILGRPEDFWDKVNLYVALRLYPVTCGDYPGTAGNH